MTTNFDCMRTGGWKSWRKEVFRGMLLLAIIATVWCIFMGRTSVKAWNVPISYGSDSLLVMAWVKSAADGNYWPLQSKIVPNLGAPFEANWNDYPVTEDVLIFGIGVLAKIVGLFAACNLAVLIAQMLAGISFYAVCRYLRYSWEWAFMGAILFSFSFYAAFRSLPHVILLYYWHIPLCLLVCWWSGSRRGLGFSGGKYWFALAVGVLTGVQNPYYTNIFLQLLGFSVLVQLVRRNAWQTVATPLSVGAATVLAFLVMNGDTFHYSYMHGKNAGAVTRNYASLEVYSLKPMELILPPNTHRLALFREIGHKYVREAHLSGEMCSGYLGLVGVCGLLWLSISTVVRMMQWPMQSLPVYALQISWVILYSIAGGLNCLLGMGGMILFRGGNRYSIVILALVLLFLVNQLTKIGGGLRSSYRILLAIVICIIGLWDQLPSRVTKHDVSVCAKSVNADNNYAKKLESSLSENAMVFQLPVVGFPEYGAVYAMSDYEHLRSFFFSKKLRYSYGDDKGRTIGDWQKEIDQMPPDKMIATLEGFGFSAIYINRKGYPDKGNALIESLKKSGREQVLQNSLGDLACVVLHPSVNPILPCPGPEFLNGFYGEEGNAQGPKWHWSYGNADITLLNNTIFPRIAKLAFEVSSPRSRQVDLIFENEKILHIALEKGAQKFENVKVTLKPGVNKLRFLTDRAASRITNSPDPRKFAFILRGFSVDYEELNNPE